MAQNIVEIIIKALDNTKSGLTTPINNLQTLQSSLGKLNTFFGIGEAAAAFFFEQLIQKSIESAASLQIMSEKTGMSVESLSTLKYAAEQSDTNIESLGIGLKKMSTLMLQAAQGNATASAAFKELGISVQNSDGSLKSQNEVLLEVATKFHGMEDGALKTALAVKIFGKSGTDMIPFLNQGGEGIKALQDKAISLGAQISGGTARDALAFQNAIKEVETGVGGLGNRIITWMLPALTSLTQEFASAFEKGQAISNVFDFISTVMKGAWSIIMSVVGALEILFKVIADVAAGMVVLAANVTSWSGMKAAAKALGESINTDINTSIKNTIQATDQASKSMNDLGKQGNQAVTSLQKIKVTAADIKKAFDPVHPDVAKFFATFQKLGTETITSVKGGMLELSSVMMTSFDQGAKTALNDLIDGGKKAGEAFKALGDAMVKGVVDWLAQMVLAKGEQLAMQALGSAILGSTTAASAAAAAGVGAAWAPAAAATSLASFGANSGPATAAILATKAVSTGAFASFALGSDYIQQTGLAMIHQGERIVPQKTNQDLTSALSGSNGGGGVVHVHFNIDNKEFASQIINVKRLGFI
jgi:hypothetical protein